MSGMVVASALLAGCGAAGAPVEQLTVEQACTEIKEPMLTPSGHEEDDRRKVVDLLRSVADRGDDDVRRIFGDAATAVDEYGDPEANRDDEPPWVVDALESMATACKAIIGDGGIER